MKQYEYKNHHRLKEIRQFLRNEPTRAEEVLWQHLRRKQLGYKFRRQYSIGNRVADFCSEAIKLVIELDGWTHEFRKTQIKDAYKERFLKEQGYAVIRFTNEQIYGDIEPIITQIKRACDSQIQLLNKVRGATPLPLSPKRGEGTMDKRT